MKNRCSDIKHKAFKDYAARGITVCERWQSFENFLADMGERPAGLTLERINNDFGYDPSNCRWASYSDQNRNKRKDAVPRARSQRGTFVKSQSEPNP